jgi:hypothetical protein
MFSYSVFFDRRFAYVQVGVNLLLHRLVFLIRIDDVLDEGLVDPVDDSPQSVAAALLLLLFQQFDLHVHEVDLLQ